MANYYRHEIEKARTTAKVTEIMDDLDFADITKAEYFELLDLAESRMAELMKAQ